MSKSDYPSQPELTTFSQLKAFLKQQKLTFPEQEGLLPTDCLGTTGTRTDVDSTTAQQSHEPIP